MFTLLYFFISFLNLFLSGKKDIAVTGMQESK